MIVPSAAGGVYLTTKEQSAHDVLRRLLAQWIGGIATPVCPRFNFNTPHERTITSPIPFDMAASSVLEKAG